MNKSCVISFIICFCSTSLFSQSDTLDQRLNFFGDFRFRVEQDWNSRKPDGTFREDRTRFRIRARIGMEYKINHWAIIRSRIRTGNINDQQGPHLTLGGNGGEFGLYQIGFDEAYLHLKSKLISAQFGKFSFPFENHNELFWNDNVCPEGISLKTQYPFSSSGFMNDIQLTVAHFIIHSNNSPLKNDAFLQAAQLSMHSRNERFKIYPAIFRFRNLSNIPDGKGTILMNYTIFHLGSSFQIQGPTHLSVGFDYFNNLEDYKSINEIEDIFKDQKQGFSIQAGIGELKAKNDFMIKIYYAHLQKYAVVDYFAQNDWARWDYSEYGVFGSRLTNFKGLEFRLGYAIDQNIKLILRTYFVNQITTAASFRETGSRVRLDIDVKF